MGSLCGERFCGCQFTSSDGSLSVTRSGNVIDLARSPGQILEWTPDLTATSGTAPDVGSSPTIDAWYYDDGVFIHAWWAITLGTGVVAGTGGVYEFSLPVSADTTRMFAAGFGNAATPIGEFSARDLAPDQIGGWVTLSGASVCRMFDSQTGTAFSPGTPFTIADGDFIGGHVHYPKAV